MSLIVNALVNSWTCTAFKFGLGQAQLLGS